MDNIFVIALLIGLGYSINEFNYDINSISHTYKVLP